MQFISTGDFFFPFNWITYWVKHFYMWSFQSGTPNPDGVIRLPGRLFNFIVFGIFGDIGAGYFYLFSTAIICFIAFFYFARKFLQVKSLSIQIIGALFFALNPIFLGNMAKVGLVLAAAMLPICLMALQAAFEHRKFRYFLIAIAGINVSFLHPYTFTVNAVVAGCYFLYLAWHHRSFVVDNIGKFALVGVVALCLNLYFVLPLKSMGTVSKDVISTNITPTAIDYTALVGISNTGDFFTGFSLSKNIFVDFAFYNDPYRNLYFFGVFTFYAVICALYLASERQLGWDSKRRLGILLGAFLVLIVLAATTVMHVDKLITFLIGMPGGWAFRSPLKWQLYIPLVLFGIMVMLLSNLPKKTYAIAAQAGLLVTFVLMNGYISYDIYQKILTPRSIEYFSSLQKRDITHKTVLFINNGECMDYMRANPRITTEFTQIFTSNDTQLKHVLEDNINSVNVGIYDYIIGCKDRSYDLLTKQYNYVVRDQYVDNNFRLYVNEKPLAPLYTPDNMYTIEQGRPIGPLYAFTEQQLKSRLTYTDSSADTRGTIALSDAFAGISPANIQGDTITMQHKPLQQGNQRLYLQPGDEALYAATSDQGIAFTASPQAGGVTLAANTTNTPLDLPTGQAATISLTDQRFDYQNLIRNPSFEEGLWDKKVVDCYAYDAKPDISMSLNQQESTKGSRSLELRAGRHIACSGPGEMTVQSGEHYLLSFDYQSMNGGKYAGYYIGFNDPKETVLNERMQNKDSSWNAFSKEIEVPEGATSLRLMLYAYPDSYENFKTTVRYDNVQFMRIPHAQDRFYVVGEPRVALKKPKHIDYELVNPTRKHAYVRGATTPFYLVMNETYHPGWELGLTNNGLIGWLPFTKRTALPESEHVKVNGTTNGWYVDPAALCKTESNTCKRNSDGSYDLRLTADFVPQRWLYTGLVISMITGIGCVIYYVRDHRRSKQAGEGKWRWK